MIFKLAVGPMACNAYIVACDETKEALVIDPGADAGRIKALALKHGLKVKCVVNTHGHGDHIGANGAFKVPILIHSLDAGALTDPVMNLSEMFFFRITSPEASRLLKDGDLIEFGKKSLTVIHTPGHTPGGISLKMGDAVFTGDTLFCGGIGRTDLPGGESDKLLMSIRHRLMALDDDTRIYPGHGPDSTIGDERRNNPFIA